MADPVRGKLVWKGSGDKRVRRVTFPTKKGMSIPTPFDPEQLVTSLGSRTEDEIEVDLELVNGKPVRIRPVGESFAASPPPQPVRSPQPQRGSQQRGQQGRASQGQRQQEGRPPAVRGAFHNPYNFVPALPRDGITGELGDHEPIGHHVLHPDRFTGVVRVKLTVKTPLLVPDAANAVDCPNDHKSFPVRIDAEGKPYIPPTSIKGMLRAAYEAVTNSRLAVFQGRESQGNQPPAGHAVPLAFRMNAEEGLRLVPARVEAGNLHLMMGTTKDYPYWDPNARRGRGGWVVPGPMYAAWLPRYRQGQLNGLKYPDGTYPQHGDQVTCWIVEVLHRSRVFSFWRVNQIFRRGQVNQVIPQDFTQVDGTVCITNANIDRKHDERVFFHQHQSHQHTITPELRERWRALICDYQSTHEDELANRARRGQQPNQYLGRNPGQTAWSRHVYQQQAEELTDGTLCYAMLDDREHVTALFPVMISRRLFESSPQSLLPKSLWPATLIQQLSAADRVFGWVNQQGKGAYKGNIRIGPVTCGTNAIIENFGTPGLPLAILGQPKPQQARFYVAMNQNGEAQPDGLTKEEAGYREESYPGTKKGLRGRKVYPHHNGLPTNHWDNRAQDRTQQAINHHFQEYHRPDNDKVRDSQNRSIQGWVKPGAEFTFDIHVANLSKVELGTLLWLLSLPDNHFHRFGGGKPLGFGSVRLEIDPASTHVQDGHGWKQTYSTLEDALPNKADRDALIQKFRDAVRTSYGSPASFEDVPFIAAWLKMATGHADSLPTHYPRVSIRPDPNGENFRWFTANEGGQRVCLGNLADDPGLPFPNAGHGGN